MATHSSVLAWRIPGTGGLVGCRLWGCTESSMSPPLSHYSSLSFTAPSPCLCVCDGSTHHLPPGGSCAVSARLFPGNGSSHVKFCPQTSTLYLPCLLTVSAAAASFPCWPLNWHWPRSRSPGEAVMVQAPPLYPVQGPEQPSLRCGTASLLPDTSIMLTSDFLGADSLLALDYLGVQPGNTLY